MGMKKKMNRDNDKKISILSYFKTTSITQSKRNRCADIQINTKLRNQIRTCSPEKYVLVNEASQIQFKLPRQQTQRHRAVHTSSYF